MRQALRSLKSQLPVPKSKIHSTPPPLSSAMSTSPLLCWVCTHHCLSAVCGRYPCPGKQPVCVLKKQRWSHERWPENRPSSSSSILVLVQVMSSVTRHARSMPRTRTACASRHMRVRDTPGVLGRPHSISWGCPPPVLFDPQVLGGSDGPSVQFINDGCFSVVLLPHRNSLCFPSLPGCRTTPVGQQDTANRTH